MPATSGPLRVAVTGSRGFVGSWFLERLRATHSAGVEAFALATSAGQDSPDIRDADAVLAAVRNCRPDVVLHLAAIAAPGHARADPTTAWQVNVMGTLNVARAVLQEAPAARLVFVSSSEVYGDSFLEAAAPLDENAVLAPRSVYAATKAAADLMIGQMAKDGLNAIRFRPFNHTGPGQADDFVVSAFARQIARIEHGLQPPVMEVGNLDAERDFLDVRDIVDAYIAACRGAGPENGAAVNLATGAPVSIRAILDTLLAAADRPIEVRTDPARLRPNDIARASGNATLAQTALGWKPQIPLEITLRDCLDFWRAQVAAPASAGA
ncbi:MAG: epimerase [Ancylobacter novellus]|uniref:Epimerase n=1 Tax=Ancylobacter novellus TaxID=921 RepID=A0A2W5SU21_ANCNO|nr:MAG: epimerase [Ancylobacter novellus]